MTAAEGLQLAAIGAAGIFVVGVVSMLLWRLEARQARRRRAPRFEAPRRMALVLEDFTGDETEELPPVPLQMGPCPGCRRNAGHDADCLGSSDSGSRLSRSRFRAKERRSDHDRLLREVHTVSVR